MQLMLQIFSDIIYTCTLYITGILKMSFEIFATHQVQYHSDIVYLSTAKII